MDIPVCVVNQKLRIAMNYKTLVSGTNGFIKFVFNVPSDWDGLGLIAHFKQNGLIYRRALDGEHSATLPSEIDAGICNLTLYGVNSDGEVAAITDFVELTIKPNDLDGETGSDDEPGSGTGTSGILVMTDDGKGNVTMITV